MSEAPQVQSTATNTQKNHNSSRSVISDTVCPHGHTTFVQYARLPSDINAAALKADSFAQHQRVIYTCNCVLS